MQTTLAKLLTRPEPQWNWQPGKDTERLKLDFTQDDVPDLIAIANFEHIPDDPDYEPEDAEWDAATHAYRALAELHQPEHLDIFLGLLKLPETADNDLFNEDIIAIVPLFGDTAVEPCLDALEDQRIREEDRLTYCDILEKLATADHRKALIIERLSAYLKQKHFTRDLNASIISALVNLEGIDAIDAIRTCHHAHLANISNNGDLEEVELDLGLRDARSSDTHPSWSEIEQQELHKAIKANLGPRPDAGVDLFIYLFDLYQRDCSVNGLSSLHATLTGALLAPRFVKPSEYLPYIWDTEDTENPYSPIWESKEDAEFFMQFIMAMHNQIVESLDQGTFEPIPDERQDHPDAVFYSLWLLSLSRSLGHWSPVASPEDLSEDQLRIIQHTSTIIQEETRAMEQGTPPDTQQEIKQLTHTLCSIHRKNKTSSPFPSLSGDHHYTEQYTRDQAKISRNAPCPCGSGRKYKRCCLN